jgi:flagellar hook-basal body complex protein FliE
MSISEINPRSITSTTGTPGNLRPDKPSKDSGIDFKKTLDSLSQSQSNSDDLIRQLAAGEDVDIHEVMIAVEETDIQFRVAMAIRDRLIDSYREVMRMSV